ncbi:MAG: O-antigen ligase family protein [Elusimicrobiota bacterium]|nr:O-antigen ligase family protein [Endomicrobiia bacterium]MDW8166697.1 O-antigen ligase family protein [Elusimicrobiota bacterium]
MNKDYKMKLSFNMILYFLVLILKYFFKYPEIYFALYLTAGIYKADPRLGFLSNFLDLTIFFEILTLLGIIFLVLKRKINVIPISIRILGVYILFISLGIIGLLYTPAPGYGTDKILRFLFITSPGFFISLILFKNRETYKRFMSIFIILAIIMTLDIITGGLSPGQIGFGTALGSNYLAVGRISGIALLYSMSFLLLNRKFLSKMLFFLILVIFIFNMFISGGRGPLLALGLSIFLISMYLLTQFKFKDKDLVIEKRKAKFFYLILNICFSSLIVILIFKSYFETIFFRLSLLERLSGESIEERLRLYETAIKSIDNAFNFIFGWGIGGFSALYKGHDELRIYPHNIFLEIISELGFLGLFSFLIILIHSLSTAFNNLKISKTEEDFFLSLSYISGLFFMLFNSSFSGDINDNRLLFVFLGLVYSYRRILRHGKNQNLSHNYSSFSF